MEWVIRSERSLYKDQWLEVRSADVELPGGKHLDHRLLRMTASAGAVCIDDQVLGRYGFELGFELAV